MRTHLRHAHAEQRAVSPIIATILLVAITVVLAAVLYVLISSISVSPNPPIGSALELGTAYSGSGPAPTVWFENMSVESSASQLTIASISFSVQTPSSGVVAPPAGSTILLINTENGLAVATYTFATGAWTGAPLTTHPTSSDVLSVQWKQTSAIDPLTGDHLVAAGNNGFSGTLSTTLA